MRKLIPILILLLLPSCAHLHHQPYDTTEKVLTGVFVAGEAVDTAQTWKFMGGDRFYEMNPLIGTRRDLVHIKAGVTVAVLGVSYFLPRKWRKYLLGFAGVIAWGTVVHNYRQGVRIFH